MFCVDLTCLCTQHRAPALVHHDADDSSTHDHCHQEDYHHTQLRRHVAEELFWLKKKMFRKCNSSTMMVHSQKVDWRAIFMIYPVPYSEVFIDGGAAWFLFFIYLFFLPLSQFSLEECRNNDKDNQIIFSSMRLSLQFVIPLLNFTE